MNNTMNNTINQLFEYHFKAEYNTDEKSKIGSTLKIRGLLNNPSPQQKDLALHFKSIKKRYSISMDYFTTEDFIQEYAGLFLFVAQELEILEPIDYLLANPDIYKQRIRFIKDGINREMYSVANPSKVKVNTKDGYKYIDMNTVSLDAPIDESNEPLSNLISDENSIFKQTESHHNHFIQWFLDNKERLLTAKQLTTFEKLSEIYHPKAGNTKEENQKRQLMLQEANLNNRNMKLLFSRIKKRVVEEYEKEFNGVYHSHSHEEQQEIFDCLTQYLEYAIYPNWNTAEERQLKLTQIIRDNYNEYEQVEIIITKGLSLEEKREVVRAVNGIILISHKVLCKISTNIKDEIDKQKPLMIEGSYPQFEYAENLFRGLSQISQSNLVITPTGNILEKNNILS